MGDLSLGLAKIKELLKEVTVDYSQNDTVDKAVASVREVLLGLPDQKVSVTAPSERFLIMAGESYMPLVIVNLADIVARGQCPVKSDGLAF